MTRDAPFPADIDEFFERAAVRGLESDLTETLRERMRRETLGVRRLPQPDTVIAVARRLVPSSVVPAEALAVFVDAVFDEQRGRADEQVGLLPRGDLIPAGFRALDDAAQTDHGMTFSELGPEDQDRMIERAERGELSGSPGFESSYWFKRVRELLLLGYASDPRGMVEMGFPGPSFATGHVWLDPTEVWARTERRAGFLRL